MKKPNYLWIIFLFIFLNLSFSQNSVFAKGSDHGQSQTHRKDFNRDHEMKAKSNHGVKQSGLHDRGVRPEERPDGGVKRQVGKDHGSGWPWDN